MKLTIRDREIQALGSAKMLVQLIDALASKDGNIKKACIEAKIDPDQYYKAKQTIENSEYDL